MWVAGSDVRRAPSGPARQDCSAAASRLVLAGKKPIFGIGAPMNSSRTSTRPVPAGAVGHWGRASRTFHTASSRSRSRGQGYEPLRFGTPSHTRYATRPCTMTRCVREAAPTRLGCEVVLRMDGADAGGVETAAGCRTGADLGTVVAAGGEGCAPASRGPTDSARAPASGVENVAGAGCGPSVLLGGARVGSPSELGSEVRATSATPAASAAAATSATVHAFGRSPSGGGRRMVGSRVTRA